MELDVSSLKSQEKQQELQKHLQETMINKDIELFAMEDLDGKKVDLSKMKGEDYRVGFLGDLVRSL